MVDRFDGGDESRVQALMAENERLRVALRSIAALDADDADPGYVASPDYWVGIGEAADIASGALDA